MAWVEKKLPALANGGVEYREFIETLELAKKQEWANWLIGNFEVGVLAEKWRIDWILEASKGKLRDDGGYSARIGSSGDSARIGSSGHYAQIGSSGDSARIEASGKNSIVAAAGYDTRAKAGENGCIALAWWDEKSQRPRMTVGYVGEDGIKADTWYGIVKGKVAEL